VLKVDHGERVGMDINMLAALVASGHADPELLNTHARMQGLVSADGISLARFQPLEESPTAAAPNQGAVVNPLGAPSITGASYTVDLALNNPTRVITPVIMDLTRTRFFIDRVFASAGGVSGGAVVYDDVAMDLYADRDIERVVPGTEFPIVTFSRRAPRVAEVEKWGGKFYFTDEARDRNEIRQFNNAVRQLSNTVVRKINQRGVEILEALITANSRSVSGQSWGAVVTAGATPTNFTGYPQRDFAKADLVSEQEELGIDFNLWILNPLQMFDLEGIYGDKLAALLDSFDIDIFVTNRVTAGTAYAVAEGQVGEIRIEKPLGSETWRDPNGKEQTWVQSSVRPLLLANNPFAVLKFTGLT
jgi:hypothetical protein